MPKVEFDDSHFTPRELRLMHQLAERFADERSQPLINFTHNELGPWAKIWDSGRGFNTRIPYALAIPDSDEFAAAIRHSADDYAAIHAALGTAH